MDSIMFETGHMKYFVKAAILFPMLFIIVPIADAQSPTITVFSNLTFGMSLGNATNTVAPADPGAASFEIQVPGFSMSTKGSASIQVSISVPYSLTSGKKNSMNVTYSANSGAWNTTNSFSGVTFFSPSSGLSQTLYADTPLDLYVWIGGTATPGGTWQAAGDYTGSISVSVLVTVTDKGKTKYTASQTIPVSATVIQGLSMTASGALDFGQIVAGTTPPAILAQSGFAPKITAAGGGGENVTVTYSSRVPMNDSYGDSLIFTPSVYGSDVSTNQSGASAVLSQSQVTLSGTSGATGYYYFWLGGSIAPVPAGQSPGSYTGNFTITVNY